MKVLSKLVFVSALLSPLLLGSCQSMGELFSDSPNSGEAYPNPYNQNKPGSAGRNPGHNSPHYRTVQGPMTDPTEAPTAADNSSPDSSNNSPQPAAQNSKVVTPPVVPASGMVAPQAQ